MLTEFDTSKDLDWTGPRWHRGIPVVRNRITSATLVFLTWWSTQMVWLSQDTLLRDGDEEGHVGAMELFKDIWLEQGWLVWGQEIWYGNYGEYPPLFAGILGLWWGIVTSFIGITPPESLWIRGVLPMSVCLMAVACGRIAWRYKLDWHLVAVWVACIPLLNGVGRHFMLEPWMSMWVCLATMCTVEAIHKPSMGRWILSGLLAGCALMTKQTAIVFLLPIWMGLFWHHRKQLAIQRQYGVWCLIALLCVSMPWYGSQISTQWVYLTSSATGKVNPISWMQMVFYPVRILFDLPNILAITLLFWHRRMTPRWLWGWMASILLLMMIPKQYPRLMITWLPIIGFLLGSLDLSKNVRLLTIFSALLGFWVQSFHPVQQTLHHGFAQLQQHIDDGCPQFWIRPPHHNDAHLSEIAQILQQTNAQYLIIEGDPTIPCHIQSTHNWRNHVDPYLRRRGIEVQIVDRSPNNISSSQWQQDSIQIRWKGDSIESDVQIEHVSPSNSRSTPSTP